jgi:hypothetical protein
VTVTLTSLSPTYAAINTETELAIVGAELTKTTTTLFVGGVQTTFEWVSDVAIKALVQSDEPGPVEVVVEKGGVRSNPLTLTFTEEATSELPDDTVTSSDTVITTYNPEQFQTEQQKEAAAGHTDPVSAPVEPGVATPVDVSASEPYAVGAPYAVHTEGVPMNQPPPLGWPGALTGQDAPPNTPNRILNPA